MRERLITLLCAIGALALFYTLFLPKPQSMEDEAPRPTTAESGRNGYLGAMRWLEGARVRTESLRERYGGLTKPDAKLARTGNLLITTLPHRYGVRANEYDELWSWVQAGNTVLVLAALADTPDWTMPYYERDLPSDVSQITGVDFEVPPDDPQEVARRRAEEAKPGAGETAQAIVDALKRLDEPRRHRIAPNRAHPLFADVREVVAESEYPASEWRVVPPYGAFVLSLAHDADNGRDAFWIRNYGAGRFLISGYGSLFANEQLGQADNARLLANIVAQALGPDGAVLFDDQHQGLSELYDSEAFFADGRLHATLWLLLGLWFVWVLGSSRLRSAPAEPPAPRETAFVEATGGFLARVLHPVQAGRRLLEHFFNDQRRRLGREEDGTPVWPWLARQPRVAHADLAELRSFEERLRSARRVNLTHLQNLLAKIQGQL
jgi:hypothetical protein